MTSQVDSGDGMGFIHDGNWANLSLNGEEVPQSLHHTYTEGGMVGSTGGREVTMELNLGDNIKVNNFGLDGMYLDIIFCAEYIPKM